jgi:hypothetical protein
MTMDTITMNTTLRKKMEMVSWDNTDYYSIFKYFKLRNKL